MPMNICVSSLIAVAAGAVALAGPTSNSPLVPPPNGPKSAEPGAWAVVGATVHPRPGVALEDHAVLMSDGFIVGVVPEATADLAGYRSYDAEGMHVYAAFVDMGIEVDAPKPDANEAGAHWHHMVTPRRRALAGEGLTDKESERLRSLGFGAASIAPKDGIFRGVSGIVSTAKEFDDPSQGAVPAYVDGVFQSVGFDRDRSGSTRAYPGSVTGAVSIIRQVLSDADWAAATGADPSALTPLTMPFPLVFDCTDELMALLADDIAREFQRNAMIRGSGTELHRLDAIAEAGWPVIVPLRFPAKPDLSSPGAIDALDLEAMMEWEQAPTNPRRLHDAGLAVAITSANLPKGAKFYDNLRRAIDEGGLAEDDALAMLTTTPASLLGMSSELGAVEEGMRANVLVTSGPVFGEETERRAIFVDGRLHELEAAEEFPLDGTWAIRLGGNDSPLRMTFDGKSVTFDDESDDEAEPTKGRSSTIDGGSFRAMLDAQNETGDTTVLSGALTADGTIHGVGINPNGDAFEFTATRVDSPEESDDEADDEDDAVDPAPEDFGGYPFGPYAVSEIPEQGTVLFTNATVWTSGPDGIIDDGFVMIDGGTITAVGPMADAPSAGEGVRVIDCEGKHITPGLLDCHSHTGLFRFGVNEAGQAVTAEVRIHDSLDPGDISWYRQLGGGITTVNSLHGSANPIGGQNAVHKNRWGARHPEDLLLEGAPSGIKFALGENVKQSNWGDRYTTRYPQTRMGVETLIRDRFIEAREYAAHAQRAAAAQAELAELQQQMQRTQTEIQGKYPPIAINWALQPEHSLEDAWQRVLESGQVSNVDPNELLADMRAARALFDKTQRLQRSLVQRRDLELETLAEILSGERLIHCHSYRQDEILMLCRIAEEFGFKIGTFQHALEVYKVAETVREHAIGASNFSDWWAYKVEVQDAIPHAGPIQHEVGVLTSYNSDDNELARRMNLEAAKAVKYSDGRISPEEALKFVTINPAIQLGAGDLIGSLEPGKHADVVVWSGDPLSTYSRVLHTFVDGRELFSDAIDADHRERIAAERKRLIQKIVAAPDRGEDEAKDDEPDADDPTDTTDGDDDPERRRSLMAAVQRDLRLGQHDKHDERGECGCWFLGAGIDLED
ncbi:MAG: amidohydrolase family protein [Phycisphaerales bacterium]